MLYYDAMTRLDCTAIRRYGGRRDGDCERSGGLAAEEALVP